MRLRNITGSKDVIAQSPMVVHDPKQYKRELAEGIRKQSPCPDRNWYGEGKVYFSTGKIKSGN